MEYFRPVIATAPGHIPSPYLPADTGIIKLNSNENPYPPSPRALHSLKTFEGEWLRRYPDPYAQEFCTVAAEILGVPQDWIIVSNGCDDLLTMLCRALVDQDRPLVYPTPTYGLYPTLAQLSGAPIIAVPYSPKQTLPIDQLQAAHGAMTLVASPNSPSGHQIPLTELRKLAETVRGVLVIDEAYVDFAEGSALSLVHTYGHVMVLRTLSKGYSLAGLRFGFGIAQPSLLSGLFKVKDSYGVDAIAIKVAAAAMADQPYKNRCVSHIKAERQQLTKNLRTLGFEVEPSQGNFILAAHPEAQRLRDDLNRKDIWVRHYPQPGLEDKLRITIGLPEQNKQLLQTLHVLLHI